MSGLVVPLHSQPRLQWTHNYHGSLASDQSNAIVVGSDGSTYVTGSTDVFGQNKDIIVIKYNVLGDIVWTRTWNRSANGIDEANAIALDLFDNVYVTGRSQTSGDNFNIVTIKYDKDGAMQWGGAKLFSNANQSDKNDIGLNITVDAFGNSYVVGRSNNRGAVIKYDTNGNLLWSDLGSSLSSTSQIRGYSIVLLKSNANRLIVGGGKGNGYLYEYDISTGDIEHTYRGLAQGYFGTMNPLEPIAVKVNSSGAIFSQVQYNGNTNISGEPRRVYVIKYNDGISDYVDYHWYSWGTGTYGADLEVVANDTVYSLMNIPHGTDRDFFLVKLSPSLDTVWTRRYDSSPSIDDVPISLSVHQKNGATQLYAVGNSAGNISVVKYNSDGSLAWQDIYDCGENGPDLATTSTQDVHGNLYVSGYSNCGLSNNDIKTMKYCVCPPDAPGPISGITATCSGENVELSVPLDPDVEAYVWDLPLGWTGNSSTNTIEVVVTDGAQAGVVSVTAFNDFCSSTPTIDTLAIFQRPNIPNIMGEELVCSGQEYTFSTPVQANVDAYQWILPDSWTGNTSGNNIEVFPGTSGGFLQLVAENQCGLSDTQSVFVEVLVTPEIQDISGEHQTCLGGAHTYSVEPITDYTYTWILPTGWSSNNSTASSINTFAGESGEIAVVAHNGMCRSDTQRIQVTVHSEPDSPEISGPFELCVGDVATYSLDAVSEATSYYWFFPADWTIIDSSELEVTAVAGTSGSIQVSAENMCFNSMSDFMEITVYDTLPISPSSILGQDSVCFDSTYVYSISDVAGASSYDWIWPTGWTVLSNTGDSIILKAGMQDGVVAISVANACGLAQGPSLSAIVKEVCVIVGTSELGLDDQIAIYPNPSDGIINIRSEEYSLADVELYNSLGQAVNRTSDIDLGSGMVDLSQYSPGVYFLKIAVDQKHILRKIVLQ